MRKLERTHPELRVNAHEENSGFPIALNTVLSEARGVFVAFFDDDDASVPTRVVRQYQRIVGYEAKHPGATISCYSNRDVVEAGNQSPSMRLLGIGRVPVEPFGPQVADYVLGLLQGRRSSLLGKIRKLHTYGPDAGSARPRFLRCSVSSVRRVGLRRPRGISRIPFHQRRCTAGYSISDADGGQGRRSPPSVSPPTRREAPCLLEGEEMLCRRVVLHACAVPPHTARPVAALVPRRARPLSVARAL